MALEGKKYFLVYSREIKNSCVLLISTKLICTLFLWKLSDERKAIILGSIDFRCRDSGFASRKWSFLQRSIHLWRHFSCLFWCASVNSWGKRAPCLSWVWLSFGLRPWAVQEEARHSVIAVCFKSQASSNGHLTVDTVHEYMRWGRGGDVINLLSLLYATEKSTCFSSTKWKIQKKTSDSRKKCLNLLVFITAILIMCIMY